MKTSYDPKADAAYIALSDGPVNESEEVAPGIILDFDDAGRVLGIEVLHVTKTLAPGALASFVSLAPAHSS